MRPRDATQRRWYLFERRERCRVFSEEKGQSREPGGAGENTQIAKECATGKPCPRPVGLLIHSVGDVLLGHSNRKSALNLQANEPSVDDFGIASPILLVLALPGSSAAHIFSPSPWVKTKPDRRRALSNLRLLPPPKFKTEKMPRLFAISRALSRFSRIGKKAGGTWVRCNTKQTNTPEAARAFEKVVADAPRLGPAWALLGLCEFELKQYKESLAHLETAQTLGLGHDPKLQR